MRLYRKKLLDIGCMGDSQRMHAPEWLQAAQDDHRRNNAAGEREQRCHGRSHRIGRCLCAGQGHVMAQRLAVLHRLVHSSLNRVNDLAGVCSARSCPYLDASVWVYVDNASGGGAVYRAVTGSAWPQASWHRAERARPALVGDVVHVDDDDAPEFLVSNSVLQRHRSRLLKLGYGITA